MADFDITAIDDVIHGRLRLGIMAYLAGAEAAEFTTLKTKLQASDGNLSVSLRKLEDAGYITIAKHFAGRKPVTTAKLTEAGRNAFLAYLAAIEKLLPEHPQPQQESPG